MLGRSLSTRRPNWRSRSFSLVLSCLAVGGCAGASQEGVQGDATSPSRCSPAPVEAAARRATIDDVGRRAWAAMLASEPQQLLLDDLDLHTLLDSGSATRFAARRGSLERRLGPLEDLSPMLSRAEYAGLCLQGARDEPASGVLGLTQSGWIFERLLLIGQQPGGRRVAAWIEGTFVLTDQGFYALDLERVEQPRWEHSDLEIAPCDLSIRGDLEP
ncbi:MAG: hypothetical protein AB8I08_35825 [Sandaracinaceae bacterium]